MTIKIKKVDLKEALRYLADYPCQICLEEIADALEHGKETVYKASGTTVGCYIIHYFELMRDAKTLADRENKALSEVTYYSRMVNDFR